MLPLTSPHIVRHFAAVMTVLFFLPTAFVAQDSPAQKSSSTSAAKPDAQKPTNAGPRTIRLPIDVLVAVDPDKRQR